MQNTMYIFQNIQTITTHLVNFIRKILNSKIGTRKYNVLLKHKLGQQIHAFKKILIYFRSKNNIIGAKKTNKF